MGEHIPRNSPGVALTLLRPDHTIELFGDLAGVKEDSFSSFGRYISLM
jgi:hypothetical protein